MTTLDRVILYVGVPVAVILGFVSMVDLEKIEHKSIHFLANTTVIVTVTPCAGGAVPCNCTFDGSEGNWTDGNGNTFAIVHPDWTILWQTGTPLPLDVEFPQQTSPFYGFKSASGSASSGQASGANGNTFKYDTVAVNKVQCSNARTNGLVMR